MSERRTPWLAVGIVTVVVMIVVAFLVFLTRPSFSTPNRIDHWDGTTTQTSPSPVYVTKSFQTIPKEYVVKSWRRHIRQSTPVHHRVMATAGTAASVWCATTQRNVTGYNGWGTKLVWGTLSIHQCWGYLNGHLTNRFYDWGVQTWCGGLTAAMYDCVGGRAETIVRGSGISSRPGHVGIRYRYRRATFHFTQGLDPFTLHLRSFASLTVRADGSYQGDSGG